MTNKDQLKKELSNYTKDELIEALLFSAAATGFVITKCKALYGVKDAPAKKGQKVKDNAKDN